MQVHDDIICCAKLNQSWIILSARTVAIALASRMIEVKFVTILMYALIEQFGFICKRGSEDVRLIVIASARWLNVADGCESTVGGPRIAPSSAVECVAGVDTRLIRVRHSHMQTDEPNHRI